MTASEFGMRVRRLRVEAGLSQLELSLRCGDLASSYIGFIEQGKKVPTITTMNKIAHGLGLTLGELVGEDAPKVQYDPSINRMIAYGMTLTPDDREDLVGLMKLIVKRFPSNAPRGRHRRVKNPSE